MRVTLESGFIDEQWVLSERGASVDMVEGGLGIWVSVTDDRYVEWLEAPEDEMPQITADIMTPLLEKMKSWPKRPNGSRAR